MWVRHVRAVTFSDTATLRRPFRSEVLGRALHEHLVVRGVSVPLEAFLAEWNRAMQRRAEARWSELAEEPLEATVAAILPETVDGLAGVIDAAIESLAPEIEWFPDALPTLDFLHEAGYRIAVVCDSPAPLGPSWQARMAPWVDVVVLSREVGRVKPHASVFKEVLSRLGAIPKQVLHVGDQLVADVFGAKAVGMRSGLLERLPRDPPPPESFAWLRRVHAMEPEDVVPDLKMRTLEEIPPVVDEFA